MSNPALSPTGHMRRALRLAAKGKGWVLPNPMVGAILVKDGKRIGEGYHMKYGDSHAEVNALKNATESTKGATLYVTLEPCCHQGKTGPCTEAVIEARIQKVVIASLDPSDKVNGKGAEQLRAAGIEVEVGLLGPEAEKLNEAFYTFHRQKRPFLTLKAAMSYDAKIAKSETEQTPLTGAAAQKFTHQLRHEHQAILVGAGTVLTDDPHLGVRALAGHDPLRIVLKGDREIPSTAQIFRDGQVLVLENKDIESLLKELYERNIISILVEGGSKVFSTFLEAKRADRLHFILAPTLLGEKALPFVQVHSQVSLSAPTVQKLGRDILVTATPQWDLNNG